MSYNPFSLENKTILITGASSGIGKTTAIECSRMGAKLVITARNEKRLHETFQQLEGAGHIQIAADLTSNDDIEGLVNAIPQLDGLVNNAGILKPGIPIQFIKENDLDTILKTNTLVPVFFTQNLLKKKKFNKNASIVFTSSIGGNFKTTPGNAMYEMSKGALNNFMKSAALEFAQKGIRCNSVNPGMIETPLTEIDAFSKEDVEKSIAKYPLKRYGKPEEIAFGIIYLLSDAASWVTGTRLIIDGGITL